MAANHEVRVVHDQRSAHINGEGLALFKDLVLLLSAAHRDVLAVTQIATGRPQRSAQERS